MERERERERERQSERERKRCGVDAQHYPVRIDNGGGADAQHDLGGRRQK